ncbi:hypothetical protein C1878_03090 [Gordonibacter sp. 28C]|nr:hypothetical protein C1878_03090 [Gordonibacter sp. 28C]
MLARWMIAARLRSREGGQARARSPQTAQAIKTWQDMAEQIASGVISEEEYESWKVCFKM